jgi:hypothetical protein
MNAEERSIFERNIITMALIIAISLKCNKRMFELLEGKRNMVCFRFLNVAYD